MSATTTSAVTSTVSAAAVFGCRLSRVSTDGVIIRCGAIAVRCSSVEASSASTAVLGRELQPHTQPLASGELNDAIAN